MPISTYVQNVNNDPYGLANANGPGSPYAIAFNRRVTSLLDSPVDPVIFDAQPQQFLDLQYLMAFASDQEPGDECRWYEDVWGRSPIVTRATFAGVAAGGAGVNVNGVIPITAATLPFVYPGQQLYYTGSNGVYTQVVVVSGDATGGSEAITVRSQSGQPIAPLTSAGAEITNGLTLGGDGGEQFTQPNRLSVIERSNLIEKIGSVPLIWNKLERLKMKNTGRTDYMERQMKNMLTQSKVSLCQRVWIGKYGENLTFEGAIAKNTEGIVPAIQNNGGAQLTSTMSTVWDDLRAAMHATNFGPTSNERVAFAHPEMLDAMNLKQKAELVRYTPESSVYDMGFETWMFGGQKLTLVPTQIWGDPASFPAEYRNRIVVLQKGSTKLVTMKGVPMLDQQFKVSQSRSNVDPIAIYDFERYTIEGMVGTKTQNAAQNIIIDVNR